LVQGTNGSFYGTTATGGSSGYGTIFRITIPPAFQSITKTNGQIVLTWCIMPGQAYQLQYTGSLTPTNWLNLGSLTTAATPTVTTSDTIGSNTQRFYRVMSSQ
jgi:uncharacterized repeat protein (TIGR03803 family)